MRRQFINESNSRQIFLSEKGIYLPIIAATLVAFILLIGYALDLGSLSVNKSRLQRAVDSAAMSAVFFYDGKNNAYVKDAAEAMARTNLERMNVAFDPLKINADPDFDGDPATNILRVEGTLDVPLLMLKYVPGLGLSRPVTAVALSERNSIIMTLVLDVSASMTWCLEDGDIDCPTGNPDGERPLDYLRRAAIRFVELFDEQNDQVSVVLFDTGAEVLEPMAAPFIKTTVVSNMDASGGKLRTGGSNTDIDEGLQIGGGQFSFATPDVGAKRVIVVMTDGSPNLKRNTNESINVDHTTPPYYCGDAVNGPGEMECRKQFLATLHTADSIRDDGIRFYVIGLGAEPDPLNAGCADVPYRGAVNCSANLKPIFLRRMANDPKGRDLGDASFVGIGDVPTHYGITPPIADVPDYDSVVGPNGLYFQTPNREDLDALFQRIGQNIRGRLTK